MPKIECPEILGNIREISERNAKEKDKLDAIMGDLLGFDVPKARAGGNERPTVRMVPLPADDIASLPDVGKKIADVVSDNRNTKTLPEVISEIPKDKAYLYDAVPKGHSVTVTDPVTGEKRPETVLYGEEVMKDAATIIAEGSKSGKSIKEIDDGVMGMIYKTYPETVPQYLSQKFGIARASSDRLTAEFLSRSFATVAPERVTAMMNGGVVKGEFNYHELHALNDSQLNNVAQQLSTEMTRLLSEIGTLRNIAEKAKSGSRGGTRGISKANVLEAKLPPELLDALDPGQRSRYHVAYNRLMKNSGGKKGVGRSIMEVVKAKNLLDSKTSSFRDLGISSSIEHPIYNPDEALASMARSFGEFDYLGARLRKAIDDGHPAVTEFLDPESGMTPNQLLEQIDKTDKVRITQAMESAPSVEINARNIASRRAGNVTTEKMAVGKTAEGPKKTAPQKASLKDYFTGDEIEEFRVSVENRVAVMPKDTLMKTHLMEMELNEMENAFFDRVKNRLYNSRRNYGGKKKSTASSQVTINPFDLVDLRFELRKVAADTIDKATGPGFVESEQANRLSSMLREVITPKQMKETLDRYISTVNPDLETVAAYRVFERMYDSGEITGTRREWEDIVNLQKPGAYPIQSDRVLMSTLPKETRDMFDDIYARVGRFESGYTITEDGIRKRYRTEVDGKPEPIVARKVSRALSELILNNRITTDFKAKWVTPNPEGQYLSNDLVRLYLNAKRGQAGSERLVDYGGTTIDVGHGKVTDKRNWSKREDTYETEAAFTVNGSDITATFTGIGGERVTSNFRLDFREAIDKVIVTYDPAGKYHVTAYREIPGGSRRKSLYDSLSADEWEDRWDYLKADDDVAIADVTRKIDESGKVVTSEGWLSRILNKKALVNDGIDKRTAAIFARRALRSVTDEKVMSKPIVEQMTLFNNGLYERGFRLPDELPNEPEWLTNLRAIRKVIGDRETYMTQEPDPTQPTSFGPNDTKVNVRNLFERLKPKVQEEVRSLRLAHEKGYLAEDTPITLAIGEAVKATEGKELGVIRDAIRQAIEKAEPDHAENVRVVTMQALLEGKSIDHVAKVAREGYKVKLDNEIEKYMQYGDDAYLSDKSREYVEDYRNYFSKEALSEIGAVQRADAEDGDAGSAASDRTLSRYEEAASRGVEIETVNDEGKPSGAIGMNVIDGESTMFSGETSLVDTYFIDTVPGLRKWLDGNNMVAEAEGRAMSKLEDTIASRITGDDSMIRLDEALTRADTESSLEARAEKWNEGMKPMDRASRELDDNPAHPLRMLSGNSGMFSREVAASDARVAIRESTGETQDYANVNIIERMMSEMEPPLGADMKPLVMPLDGMRPDYYATAISSPGEHGLTQLLMTGEGREWSARVMRWKPLADVFYPEFRVARLKNARDPFDSAVRTISEYLYGGKGIENMGRDVIKRENGEEAVSTKPDNVSGLLDDAIASAVIYGVKKGMVDGRYMVTLDESNGGRFLKESDFGRDGIIRKSAVMPETLREKADSHGAANPEWLASLNDSIASGDMAKAYDLLISAPFGKTPVEVAWMRDAERLSGLVKLVVNADRAGINPTDLFLKATELGERRARLFGDEATRLEDTSYSREKSSEWRAKLLDIRKGEGSGPRQDSQSVLLKATEEQKKLAIDLDRHLDGEVTLKDEEISRIRSRMDELQREIDTEMDRRGAGKGLGVKATRLESVRSSGEKPSERPANQPEESLRDVISLALDVSDGNEAAAKNLVDAVRGRPEMTREADKVLRDMSDALEKDISRMRNAGEDGEAARLAKVKDTVDGTNDTIRRPFVESLPKGTKVRYPTKENKLKVENISDRIIETTGEATVASPEVIEAQNAGTVKARVAATVSQVKAHKVNFPKEYAVVDIETNARKMDDPDAKIKQIGGVVVKDGKEVRRFDFRIDEELAGTDRSNRMAEVLDGFEKETSGLPVVGHNFFRFDAPFIAMEAKRIGRAAPKEITDPDNIYDTGFLYLGLKEGVYKDDVMSLGDFYNLMGSNRSGNWALQHLKDHLLTRLGHMTAEEGTALEAHEAVGDSIVTWKLLQFLEAENAKRSAGEKGTDLEEVTRLIQEAKAGEEAEARRKRGEDVFASFARMVREKAGE
ncbi:MAG: hypothetical protein WC455_10115 [Dehalococcoidia bacterium]|jgi:hypothetical protein